jgi:hypothetical protein
MLEKIGNFSTHETLVQERFGLWAINKCNAMQPMNEVMTNILKQQHLVPIAFNEIQNAFNKSRHSWNNREPRT